MTLEEAIKILSELHDQCCQADSIFCTDTTGARCEAVDMAISALEKQMPTIEPEQKRGKWIYDGDCYICNQCKSAFGWWAYSQTSNYCPNCGAKMEGEQ